MTFWTNAIPTAAYILVAAYAARRLVESYEQKKMNKQVAGNRTFTGELNG